MDEELKPWKPMTDVVDLKYIGKLNEELGELITILSRCQIQGIDEHNEKEGKSNRLCLRDEIADVMAGCELIVERFFDIKEDLNAIIFRKGIKKSFLRKMHKAPSLKYNKKEY